MAKVKKGSAAPVVKGKATAQQGKGKRIQTQPPGYPQGVHDSKIGDACRCGRCNNKLLGR
jgi:hypothetical protein